jgi:hypothetical protein
MSFDDYSDHKVPMDDGEPAVDGGMVLRLCDGGAIGAAGDQQDRRGGAG